MDLKREAAQRALQEVQSGMVLGLGSGSTLDVFVDLLADALRSGQLRDIRAVPASQATAARMQQHGLPRASLGEVGELHLAIDGADEFDASLNLIKGWGKALLREKIVAIHARRFIVIVDETKRVQRLGTRGFLPVEILPFEYEAHLRWLGQLPGCRAELWCETGGQPTRTDNGNFLARCFFEGGIPNPAELAQRLDGRPGILEHGLFLGMAAQVIVSGPAGVEVLERAILERGHGG